MESSSSLFPNRETWTPPLLVPESLFKKNYYYCRNIIQISLWIIIIIIIIINVIAFSVDHKRYYNQQKKKHCCNQFNDDDVHFISIWFDDDKDQKLFLLLFGFAGHTCFVEKNPDWNQTHTIFFVGKKTDLEIIIIMIIFEG